MDKNNRILNTLHFAIEYNALKGLFFDTHSPAFDPPISLVLKWALEIKLITDFEYLQFCKTLLDTIPSNLASNHQQ